MSLTPNQMAYQIELAIEYLKPGTPIFSRRAQAGVIKEFVLPQILELIQRLETEE